MGEHSFKKTNKQTNKTKHISLSAPEFEFQILPLTLNHPALRLPEGQFSYLHNGVIGLFPGGFLRAGAGA